jgi:hypothetical protein
VAEGVSALDDRLYGWLHEPDERRFSAAFTAYYALACPAVLRRLRRLSPWDLADLEEIAQDALIKFFERAGRGRREAAASIWSLLPRLRPLALGDLHSRRVSRWSSDVHRFRSTVMAFRPVATEVGTSAAWKTEIRLHADSIAPLQQGGWLLIEEVRHHLGEGNGGSAADDAGQGKLIQFATELSSDTEQARRAETHLPGCPIFVGSVHSINVRLPLLRIPTNGLLFEIALKLYLDESRKRGRLKRGGSAVFEASRSDETGPTVGAVAVDDLYEGPALSRDIEGFSQADSTRGRVESARGVDVTGEQDETERLEQHDLLEKFYAYLRAPVDRASERCTREPSAATERRVAKMTRKFDLMMEILALIGEAYTQVEVAELLGLSRNQVKYVVESVQQAYVQFVGESPAYAAEPLDAQGEQHG